VLCHRVRLVLAAKGVTYDLIPVDPQNPPEDLIDLNPYHSVPTLVERDLVLYAASVVSEYLDERYPHPPLMPIDPLSRARLRLAMLRIEHDWVPQVQAIQLGNKQQAEAGRKRLKELLTGLGAAVQGQQVLPQPRNEPGRLRDGADHLAPARRSACRCPRTARRSRTTATASSATPGFVRSLTEQEKALRELAA
jgi:RNA polymerase-associated protein